MTAVIQKWGNSQGVRLPKHLLKEVNWSENDVVEIVAEKDAIILKKVSEKEEITIGKLFKNYKEDAVCSEYDWGEAKGRELW